MTQSKNTNLIYIPFGGGSDIGSMNLGIYQYNKTSIMVDCGSGFADDRIMPGIDLLVPDVSSLLKNNFKIDALILTHAHEDHIGAVPFLWKHFKFKIYCSKFTENLLLVKLKEHRLDKKVKIHNFNGKFSINDINIHPIGVTHSCPESNMLYITTKSANVLHTGDWKLDKDPIIGNPTDIKLIKKIVKDTDVLIGDSTNVFKTGNSGSEGSILSPLYNRVKKSKGMIVVTMFSSNIARIHTMCVLAQKLNRHIAVSGLSMHRSIAVAQKSGYLNNFTFLDAKEINNYQRSDILLICTGSQGEPLSTVAKISSNRHNLVKITKNDTIVFSSKLIPGNEKRLLSSINRLADMGLEIITNDQEHVHVSGHPNRDEIKELYKIVKPKCIIPVHGSIMHIKEHCKLAKEYGIKNSLEIRNGDVIQINKTEVKKISALKSDFLGIDGRRAVKPDSIIMRERRKIRDHGSILCSVILSKQFKLITDPILNYIGILDENEQQAFTKEINKKIKDLLSVNFPEKEKLQQQIKKNILHLILKDYNKEPLIKVGCFFS